MKMFEVNLNEVPAGLTQKEFLKQPALKKISGWVTAAGVTGILNGLSMFAIVGEAAQYYYELPGQFMIAGLLGFAMIILAIITLVTRKSNILISLMIVEVIGILLAVVGLGATIGVGVVLFVISAIAAYHYNKYWKEYVARPAGGTSYTPYQDTNPGRVGGYTQPAANPNAAPGSGTVSDSMYGSYNAASDQGTSGGFTDFTSDYSGTSSFTDGSNGGFASSGFASTVDSFYTEEPAFTPAEFYLAPVTVQGGAPLTEFQFWSGAYNKIRSGGRPQIGNIPAGYTKASAPADDKMQVFRVHNNQTNEDWLPLFTTLDSFNGLFANRYPASMITFEEAQSMVGNSAGIVIDPGRENKMLPGGRI